MNWLTSDPPVMQDSRAIVVGILAASPAVLITMWLYGMTLTHPKLRPRRWLVWLPAFALESVLIGASMHFAGVATHIMVRTSIFLFGSQIGAIELCFRGFMAAERAKEHRT